MKQTIAYVGLDVDDTQYHGSALNKTTGEVIDFKCRPTLKGLLVQLEKLGKHFCNRSMLETFVDRSRYRGTCYRATNWQCVGQTTGRTRNDRYQRIRTSPKDLYGYPLVRQYRNRLCREA